jgi:hypothetical protein
MPVGIQELIALSLVALIVCFALYRRWRRRRDKSAGCTGCGDDRATDQDQKAAEKTVHLYRRQD